MDILRKELNSIYEAQKLDKETLNQLEVERCKRIAESFISISNGCSVLTDASCDRSILFSGSLGNLLGISKIYPVVRTIESSDEDVIYSLIHPEDLVEKRMLEYEFFKFVNLLTSSEKFNYQATCRLRFKTPQNEYILIDNTTQIICPSPNGKIWLILCNYSISSDQKWIGSISPIIKNNSSGVLNCLSFKNQRRHVLTEREKEILLLIKEGKASKQIADILSISINTVNRHRQNILEKLSVANSIEAVTAAESMRLL